MTLCGKRPVTSIHKVPSVKATEYYLLEPMVDVAITMLSPATTTPLAHSAADVVTPNYLQWMCYTRHPLDYYPEDQEMSPKWQTLTQIVMQKVAGINMKPIKVTKILIIITQVSQNHNSSN